VGPKEVDIVNVHAKQEMLPFPHKYAENRIARKRFFSNRNMSSDTTLWPLAPHTVGKHKVLAAYLKAWLPILGLTSQRILFIDGFSGPGQYSGGEEGSPIIALRTFLEHTAREKFKAKVGFIFIDGHEDRINHLKWLVEKDWKAKVPKERCSISIEHGRFDDTLTTALDELEANRKKMAPALVMIDPFGVSDTPMEVIGRILANRKAEVYVSFMYEAINRFKSSPEFEKHLDSLFGCPEWRQGISIDDPTERKNFFYSLYEMQLKNAGAEHVVHFDLYEGNRLVYAIFFATKHQKGSDRMKEAIWSIDPFGNFAFRGTKSPQLTLGLKFNNFEPLKVLLKEHFKGREWVPIEEVLEYVASDQTDFYTGQVKAPVLKPMEKNGEIEVDPKSRKRRLTYPPGTRLRFL